MFNGRRQPSRDGTSLMTREYQVRFCERLGVKFPGPTRQVLLLPHRSTDDRLTPISRLYLKLIGSPEKCHFRTHAVQRRLTVWARLGATASFGASTILGSRIVKVEPRPGSHPRSCLLRR